MSKSHKKKRNCALLYEFLVRTISRALIEDDQKKSAIALKILRRYFKPGTELYKEFRLMNSLLHTTVSTEAVAVSIIHEAKAAARAHDVVELDRQKSLLIKHINHALRDDSFYDQQIDEYKTYATVQTLLNDWRSTNPDIGRMGQYEDQLVKHLVVEKVHAAPSNQTSESPGTCRLLMKVMMKNLNNKYASSLTPEQKKLYRAYVFAAANGDTDFVKRKLTETRDELLVAIEEYRVENGDNELIEQKLLEVKGQLEAENVEKIDDDAVVRFMLYMKLISELHDKETK